MSTDLLPESVNLFLDDFETSLCLPILVILVLCTAQFVFNHVFGIGCTIYQSIKKPTTEEEEEEQDKTNIMDKLKGMLTTLGIGKPDTVTTTPTRNPLLPDYDTRSREEEWDYCEEDVE
ncbi:PREDICTED: uncharacterized protein LOC108779271 [Cyphomyrmex costatus]|uniref:Uncharacterized protein n=1 Tax=Cyphomyrmex costatus TaxID=456900 RepID=A0A195D4E2_9HYME|nr:PREDICTED: uncharacterized protein LOC108779271 [Cyphomyrmex costatus]XP_018402167.1 PREDICTED: uncharacterized protein LOC108779271 [Cyphomyrmex costatus]KYN07747.1 hypothetical protein ALC62_01258 [Cyphomyrmex costatus]